MKDLGLPDFFGRPVPSVDIHPVDAHRGAGWRCTEHMDHIAGGNLHGLTDFKVGIEALIPPTGNPATMSA